MTKKDYELIAGVINMVGYANYKSTTAQLTLKKVAEQLTIQFAKNNSRFDKDKFMAACGLQD